MSTQLHPLPTKTRVSFDIPRLLASLAGGKTFHTSASFDDLLTVRNYLGRHPELGVRLTQQKVNGGYIIGLLPRSEE